MRASGRFLIFTSAAGLALAGNLSVPLFFFPYSGPGSATDSATNTSSSALQFMVRTPRLEAAFGAQWVAFELGGSQIRLRFPGARKDTQLAGTGATGGRVNFFNGSTPDTWRTGLPMYDEIVYRELYPGIDLVYLGSGAELKSEFHVRPGADPS